MMHDTEKKIVNMRDIRIHPYNFKDIKRKNESSIYQSFSDKLMVLKDHKVIMD